MDPVERLATANRIASRYVQARSEVVLDEMADDLVDALFDELGPGAISEADVSRALEEGGLTPETVNSLAEGKQAGGFMHALGGLVVRGLWRLIAKPFLAIGKLFSSAAFRSEIKTAFKRALRREYRATRHALLVAERIALGQEVHPQEFKNARRQLLDLLGKVLFVYFSGPALAGLFTGGIWPALSRLMVPVTEVVAVLLDKPIRSAMAKLLAL